MDASETPFEHGIFGKHFYHFCASKLTSEHRKYLAFLFFVLDACVFFLCFGWLVGAKD